MKRMVVKNKIVFLMVLVFFVFLIFSFIAHFVPGFLSFSSKSAICAVKFSLPEPNNFIYKLNDFNLVFEGDGSSPANFRGSDLADIPRNEKSLFKSEEAAQIFEFEPPFLIGPERTNFSKKELARYCEKDGPIIRNCYRAAKNSKKIVKLSKSAYAKNLTQLSNNIIEQANEQRPSFVLNDGQQPQVLVLHTHATEAYEMKEKKFYSNKTPNNVRNFKINVVSVGEQICEQLKAAGIGVIHDKTVHDDPAYSGAYDRSNQTIRNYLEKHPSIKVVLDVHRDGIQNEQKERIAPVVKIEGRKAAQVMIVAGCDNGAMHYPNYKKNLAFACFLQRNLEEDYPNLTRPLLFKYKHYNQSLTPGTLLVEIGSNSNSVDEAKFSGWLFGKSLAKALSKLKKTKG